MSGSEEQTQLTRTLSLFDIIMIGVGAMIGAGIFILTGMAAGVAGPGLIMVFGLNGFIAVFTAMSYAELGSAIPEAGGGYLWVREALGRSQAFLSGWMSWFAHAVAGSLYAVGFGSFVTLLLVEFFNISFGISEPVLNKIFAVIAGALFTYINYRGAKETGLAGNVITMIKVTVITVFILAGVGAMFGQPDLSSDFMPFLPRGLTGIFTAMGLTFIAFEGYEIIVQSGEEVVNPRENVPKAVFYSLILVVTIYILVAVVLIGPIEVTPTLLETASKHGSLPPDPGLRQVLGNLGELGLARAAAQVLPFGTLVILVAGIFSTLSALNATTFSSTRVGFAMGRDHVLPEAFNKIHSKTRTPYLSVIFSGLLIIFMAVSLPIEDIAAATDLMFLILFIQVNYSAIKIRKERGDEINYGYKVPLFPYTPIIGICGNVFLAIYLFVYSPLAWFGAITWILIGVGIFFIYSRPKLREEERKEETQLVSEEREPAEREYKILVPISNPQTAEYLAKIGGVVAKENNGEVVFTHIVTVPDQTPLSEGKRYIGDRERELLEKAVNNVPEGVPTQKLINVGHEVGKSILNIAKERESDLILLGWKKRKMTVRGTTRDYVVKNSPTDICVAKAAEKIEPKNILIPIAGGKSVEIGKMIAKGFNKVYGSKIHLFHVKTNNKSEKLLEKHKENFVEEEIEPETHLVEDPNKDITKQILDFSNTNDIDMIILGASEKTWLGKTLFGNIPEEVGERFSGKVLMVRKQGLITSKLEKIIEKFRG